jgi:hypothetical protein
MNKSGILVLGFLVLLIAIAIGALAATNSKTLVHNGYDFTTDYQASVKVTREAGGRVWYFWTDRNGSDYWLNATYSDDEWSTWTNVTIAKNFQSWTFIQVYDALTTSNGSVVVLTRQNKPDAYSIAMWIHYAPAPLNNWSYEAVYRASATEMLNPDFAINDTNIILIIYRYSGDTIYTKEFDFDTSTLTPNAISLGTLWATSGYNQVIHVKANSTGKFWVCYGWDAGSHINLRDYKKTLANQAITAVGFMAAIGEFQILPNDVKVIPIGYSQGAVLTSEILWREDAPYAGTYNYIWLDGIQAAYQDGAPFSSIYYGNYFFVYWNNTIANTLEMVGPCLWNASESTWQATKQTVLNYVDNDIFYPEDANNDLWPRVNNVSFQIPLASFYIPCDDRQKVGATFHKDKRILINSSLAWADTNNLTITTTSIPYALLNRNYITQILQTGGNEPVDWILDYGPSGLYIDDNGWLYGKINQTGSWTIIVSCHDISGRWDNATFSLPVYTRTPSTVIPSTFDFIYPDRMCFSALAILVLLGFFMVWINYYLDR